MAVGSAENVTERAVLLSASVGEEFVFDHTKPPVTACPVGAAVTVTESSAEVLLRIATEGL